MHTLGFAGGGAVVTGLFWALFSKVLSEQIYIRTNKKIQTEMEGVKAGYATALESFRNEAGERREVLKSSMDFMSSGYTVSQERRLKAIEELWRQVILFRSEVAPYLWLYEYCYPYEYETEQNIRVKTLLGNMPKCTAQEFSNEMIKIGNGAEEFRPIVGEELWRTYRAYTAFQGRLALRVAEAAEKREKLPLWDCDTGKTTFNGKPDSAIAIAETVLTKSEIESIMHYQIGVPQEIAEAIRLKLLDQMNLAIFNKVLVHESLQERQRVASLLEVRGKPDN